MVTADQIRAQAQGGTQVSLRSYSEGSTSPVNIREKNGAIVWYSGMSIDCDGQPGSKCNINTDPYFQPDTSYHQSDGKALKAEELPFIVVPLSSDIWNPADTGIKGGDLCTIVYGDKYVHGVVGDQGPPDRIGEASYATAVALGIPPSPTSGGIAYGVTYVVYPGVRPSPIESHDAINVLGEQKLAEWLGMATSDTYTVQAGDNLSTIATTHGVDVDSLATLNNLIVVGANLHVTDPNIVVPPVVVPPVVVPPVSTVTTYIAATGDTWSSIAAKYGISVDTLMGYNNIKVAPGSSYIINKVVAPPVPADPYAMGLPFPNSTVPSAIALQKELKRVGYMDNAVENNDNYGMLTQQSVIWFHNDHTEFRGGSTDDPEIGPQGWAYLRTMLDGTGKRVNSAPVDTSSTSQMSIPAKSVLFTRTSTSSGKAFAETTVRVALTLMGLPVTDAWITGYLTMALRESSYNPNAVNTTDSNAITPAGYSPGSDGHPFQCSRGMWQCIPQTFAQYHQSGTSLSIYDPVASAAASINYVRSQYGVTSNGSNLATKVQQADPNRAPKGY